MYLIGTYRDILKAQSINIDYYVSFYLVWQDSKLL